MYERSMTAVLRQRLVEPRHFIQVISGPRQVGKTTSVTHVLDSVDLSHHYATADSPVLQTTSWIEAQWETARSLCRARSQPIILALDEIQKVRGWSEVVKLLWDTDSRTGADVRVVLLGSSALLMQQGLSDSLTGRFEIIHAMHWMYAECRDAFGWDLDTYIYHGGYPGAAPLIDDHSRWRSYIVDSLIETSISRDVLLMTRVDKPALLRQLFHLACEYSGQILAYDKMLGQLLDAGNATTLAHYLSLLSGAGLVAGLQKYSGAAVRRRGSSPKLQVLNTALMSALSPRTFEEARADAAYWGRLTESAVGAFLLTEAQREDLRVFYWRHGAYEVDFVVVRGGDVAAIEVKSGKARAKTRGSQAFSKSFPGSRLLVVGTDGLPLEQFLAGEIGLW